MSNLPVLKIRTNHSEYLIDQNAGRFSRTAAHAHASPIPGHSKGEWHEYTKVYSGTEVGEPLIIVKPNGDRVRSTLVQKIEELESVSE